MLKVHVIGTGPEFSGPAYIYRLDDYGDAEVLEKEIERDFPLGFVVIWVDGLKHVDLRTSFGDLYELNELLADEYHGEAFRLYAEHHQNAAYAFDNFEDAYHGEWGSLEEYAKDFYESCHGPFNVPGFEISVKLSDWEYDYMNLEGHIFANV
jgi:hypothetical protein